MNKLTTLLLTVGMLLVASNACAMKKAAVRAAADEATKEAKKAAAVALLKKNNVEPLAAQKAAAAAATAEALVKSDKPLPPKPPLVPLGANAATWPATAAPAAPPAAANSDVTVTVAHGMDTQEDELTPQHVEETTLAQAMATLSIDNADDAAATQAAGIATACNDDADAATTQAAGAAAACEVTVATHPDENYKPDGYLDMAAALDQVYPPEIDETTPVTTKREHAGYKKSGEVDPEGEIFRTVLEKHPAMIAAIREHKLKLKPIPYRTKEQLSLKERELAQVTRDEYRTRYDYKGLSEEALVHNWKPYGVKPWSRTVILADSYENQAFKELCAKKKPDGEQKRQLGRDLVYAIVAINKAIKSQAPKTLTIDAIMASLEEQNKTCHALKTLLILAEMRQLEPLDQHTLSQVQETFSIRAGFISYLETMNEQRKDTAETDFISNMVSDAQIMQYWLPKPNYKAKSNQ